MKHPILRVERRAVPDRARQVEALRLLLGISPPPSVIEKVASASSVTKPIGQEPEGRDCEPMPASPDVRDKYFDSASAASDWTG